MRTRLSRLQDLLREEKLDAVLITSAEGIRYFSGFTSVDGTVLVTPERGLLFTDFRYFIQARAQLLPGMELVEITTDDDTKLLELSKQLELKNVAFEEEALTVCRMEKLRGMAESWKPFGKQLASLRLCKDETEIAAMQAAQDIADRAYRELLKRVKAGMTELEVKAELEYLCARFGSEGPSFATIVGSGENGAMCHAEPGTRKLQSGDLVVVDYGCIKDGYHSDTTRTFGIGELDEELIKIYNIVREAQQLALDALKPGITGRELDAIARDHITAAGYGDCFGHSLGHGVGLLIHEEPRASKRSDTVLQAGMSITVEPGIYIEGKGGVRIEDCCILTEDGFIDLTHLEKDLVIL